MNFGQYLESNFVSSQISLSRGAAPALLAKNQATRALLWIWLQFATGAYIFRLLGNFVAILCRMTPPPASAQAIAEAEGVARRQNQERAMKVAMELAQSKAPLSDEQSIKRGTA